jgi:excisionase family DNA binding protein
VPQVSGLPGVVTADEAAKYLRVSKATVLRLANRGIILGVRIGRQWRFSRKTIISLLNHSELLQKIGSET